MAVKQYYEIQKPLTTFDFTRICDATHIDKGQLSRYLSNIR